MTIARDQPETTPCPVWCDRVQCQEPLPADRAHQRLASLPVICRASASRLASDELALALFTSATSNDDVWIGLDLGEDVASMTLSLESVHRLLPHLAALLTVAQSSAQDIPLGAG